MQAQREFRTIYQTTLKRTEEYKVSIFALDEQFCPSIDSFTFFNTSQLIPPPGPKPFNLLTSTATPVKNSNVTYVTADIIEYDKNGRQQEGESPLHSVTQVGQRAFTIHWDIADRTDISDIPSSHSRHTITTVHYSVVLCSKAVR